MAELYYTPGMFVTVFKQYVIYPMRFEMVRFYFVLSMLSIEHVLNGNHHNTV